MSLRKCANTVSKNKFFVVISWQTNFVYFNRMQRMSFWTQCTKLCMSRTCDYTRDSKNTWSSHIWTLRQAIALAIKRPFHPYEPHTHTLEKGHFKQNDDAYALNKHQSGASNKMPTCLRALSTRCHTRRSRGFSRSTRRHYEVNFAIINFIPCVQSHIARK